MGYPAWQGDTGPLNEENKVAKKYCKNAQKDKREKDKIDLSSLWSYRVKITPQIRVGGGGGGGVRWSH